MKKTGPNGSGLEHDLGHREAVGVRQGEVQAGDPAPLGVGGGLPVEAQRGSARPQAHDLDVTPQSTLVPSSTDRLVEGFLRSGTRGERGVAGDAGEAVLDFLLSEQAVEAAPPVTLADAAHAMDLDEIDSSTDDHALNIRSVAFLLHPADVVCEQQKGPGKHAAAG